MKKGLIYIILSGFWISGFAQDAIHNFGNLQLHQKGHLGFHSDFINDGSFENNLGLVGFYNNEDKLNISGAFSPSFFDFELAVDSDLHLEVPIRIDNSMNFIYGSIITRRKYKNIYSKFSEKSYYDGAIDVAKVDGFVAVEGKKSFSFPVGYDNVIKPLKIQFVDDLFLAKCAYFMENPDNPKSFANSFDTSRKDKDLGTICPQEFWYLNTSGRVQITLLWDQHTNLKYYTEDPENITVAGWSKVNKSWENLGNSIIEGGLDEGSVMSHIFNANDYEIFTYGFLHDDKNAIPGNYAVTPNGDGINDTFSPEIIGQSPNNELRIYNRSGLLVYGMTNYRNEFRGVGNRNMYQSKTQLPEGVYFYLLELKDINRSYQGYFYLVTE